MGDEKRMSATQLEWWLVRYEQRDRDCPLRGHIAALESELAHLKPSGQVAEMRERLAQHLMDWAPTPFAGQSAVAGLDHLTAKAERYEELLNGEKAHESVLSDLARIRGQQDGEDTLSAAERSASERDTAVANNAALREAMDSAARGLRRSEHRHTVAERLERAARHNPNPGAALLEQHRREVDEARVGTRHALRRISDVLQERGVTVADATSLSAVVDAIDSVMVRARNEGLEKAAVMAENAAQSARTRRAAMQSSVMRTAQDKAAETAGDLAVLIRREKEPEQ